MIYDDFGSSSTFVSFHHYLMNDVKSKSIVLYGLKVFWQRTSQLLGYDTINMEWWNATNVDSAFIMCNGVSGASGTSSAHWDHTWLTNSTHTYIFYYYYDNYEINFVTFGFTYMAMLSNNQETTKITSVTKTYEYKKILLFW